MSTNNPQPQPLSEETGKELVEAIRELSAAFRAGYSARMEPSYMVASSVIGGPDAAILENKRNRKKRKQPV